MEQFLNGLKEADVLMFLKPGKNTKLQQTYKQINLLPTIRKVVEKILLIRRQEVTTQKELQTNI